MKKNVFAALMALFAFAAVSCAFQDKWPDTYEDLEWVEISRKEAARIWDGYDTVSMRHGPLTIWEKWIGTKPQKWIGCALEGDSYATAEASIVLLGIGRLTTFPDKEPDNSIFYMKKNDSSVIKIEHLPVNEMDEFKQEVYKDGWCVEKMTYRNFSSYDLFFIKY